MARGHQVDAVQIAAMDKRQAAAAKVKQVVVKRAGGLTPSQVSILKVLSKSSVGLTAHEISHAAKGVPINTNTIGPIYEEHIPNYPDSLRGRELVRCERYEGEEVRWYITEKGRPFAGFKAHKVGPKTKIDPEILDPLVLAFKKTRTYGIEQFTNEDLTELRSKLPEDYREVELLDLRKQMEARRKQGAFADPEKKRIKCLERIVREFGPNGTVISDFLTEDQLGDLYAQLGIDAAAE